MALCTGSLLKPRAMSLTSVPQPTHLRLFRITTLLPVGVQFSKANLSYALCGQRPPVESQSQRLTSSQEITLNNIIYRSRMSRRVPGGEIKASGIEGVFSKISSNSGRIYLTRPGIYELANLGKHWYNLAAPSPSRWSIGTSHPWFPSTITAKVTICRYLICISVTVSGASILIGRQ